MMGLMDFASKFMPDMMGGKMAGNIPSFDPRILAMNQYMRTDDEEDSDDDRACKRKVKKRKREDNVKRKRLAQKTKAALEAHVHRMSVTNKPNNDILAKRMARRSSKKQHNLRPVVTLEDKRLESVASIHSKISTKTLQSKEIQTKEVPSVTNVVTMMEKEIEAFKHKRETFINYLQTLQNEIQALKIPDKKLDSEDEITVASFNEIGAGEKPKLIEEKNYSDQKSEEGANTNLTPNNERGDELLNKNKQTSNKKKSILLHEDTEYKDSIKPKRVNKQVKKTEPMRKSKSRLKVKGYNEGAKELNMDDLLPKLEKLARMEEVVPTVINHPYPKNFIRRIR